MLKFFVQSGIYTFDYNSKWKRGPVMDEQTNNIFGQYIYSKLVVIHTLVTTAGSC